MEKYKIYISDNSENVVRELEELLKPQYDIVGTGFDGNETFEFLKQNKVDLLITDLVLSSIDGFELLEKIKTLKEKPKIIVVSNLTHDGFVSKAIEEGASYFMIKPFD